MRAPAAVLLFVLIPGAAMASGAGCGSSGYGAIGTARAPAADAVTHVEEVEGGKLLVTIHVTGLSSPDRVAPDMKVFAVWFEAPKKPPEFMGLLEHDNVTREGSIAAATAHKTFDIRITAESSATPAAPSDVVVISQHISES